MRSSNSEALIYHILTFLVAFHTDFLAILLVAKLGLTGVDIGSVDNVADFPSTLGAFGDFGAHFALVHFNLLFCFG